MDTNQSETIETFAALGLSAPLIQLLNEVGYEAPTSIQQQTIPLMLEGRNLIGQAQTGTGKTAAFALPILDRLDLNERAVQALVLTPTRELAIQVAEAIHGYSKYLGRVRVMPIYGGDPISKQIGRLRGGMHIVVGTPGRVMDHLRRGTLDLTFVKTVVIDEADEMLRMGFIEDVEWILGQTPADRQTALFSATMPREVRRIADRHLDNPVSIEIKRKTMTVPTVEQHYVHVLEKQKVEALTQLLETEAVEGEAILIFASTKVGVADLADKLQSRGYAAEAMHGDMTQAQRESVIRRLREEQVEIVVATDVAARGLDIEHISHVINFDIPNDPESYVHRIGRTARAGRTGKAILFVTPRETRMQRIIEQFTGQRLTSMKIPSRADVAARRTALFKERLLKTMQDEDLDVYLALVEEIAEESGCDLAEIAAAAVRMARGDKPLEPPFRAGTRTDRLSAARRDRDGDAAHRRGPQLRSAPGRHRGRDCQRSRICRASTSARSKSSTTIRWWVCPRRRKRKSCRRWRAGPCAARPPTSDRPLRATPARVIDPSARPRRAPGREPAQAAQAALRKNARRPNQRHRPRRSRSSTRRNSR